jgi:hypothetical protein
MELAGPTGEAISVSTAGSPLRSAAPTTGRVCQRAGTARDQGLVVDRGAGVPPVGLVVVTVSVWTVVACSVVV